MAFWHVRHSEEGLLSQQPEGGLLEESGCNSAAQWR